MEGSSCSVYDGSSYGIGGCGMQFYGETDAGIRPFTKKEGRDEEETLQIAEGFRDVYEEAQAEGNLKDRKVQEELIRAIGEQGYAAVDTENRINMVNSEQMETFLQEAGQGREAEASMFCVTDEGGFIRYDLETRESVMDVTVSSLRWQNGEPEVWYTHDFEATDWEFTEKRIFFSGGSPACRIRWSSGPEGLPDPSTGCRL